VTFLDPVSADCFSDKDRALYAEKVRRRLIESSKNAMGPGKTTSRCKSREFSPNWKLAWIGRFRRRDL